MTYRFCAALRPISDGWRVGNYLCNKNGDVVLYDTREELVAAFELIRDDIPAGQVLEVVTARVPDGCCLINPDDLIVSIAGYAVAATSVWLDFGDVDTGEPPPPARESVRLAPRIYTKSNPAAPVRDLRKRKLRGKR